MYTKVVWWYYLILKNQIQLTINLIKLKNINTINNYLIPYLSIDILPKPLSIIPTINNYKYTPYTITIINPKSIIKHFIIKIIIIITITITIIVMMKEMFNYAFGVYYGNGKGSIK